MLHERILGDLKAAGVALSFIRPSAQTLVPFDDGPPIVLSDSVAETVATIAKHSSADAAAFPRFAADLTAAIDCLRPFRSTPSSSLDDFLAALHTVNPVFPSLFGTGSITATLEHYFTSPTVVGALCSSMLLYNSSTTEPGSALAFPFYGQMAVEGAPGWTMLSGGMGKFTEELANAVSRHGAESLVDTQIVAFEIAEGRIVAAIDAAGVHHTADLFVAACDPLRLCDLLAVSGHISPQWTELRDLWARPSFRGMCGKANYLLRETPRFRLVADEFQDLARRTLVTNLGSSAMMDEAFRSAQANGVSDAPYIEILLPSEIDPSQSCGSHVVMSVYFMYSLYEEAESAERDDLVVRALEDVLRRHVENLESLVLSREVLSNTALAHLFGFSRGNVDHGSLVLDYCFNRRGLPGTNPPFTDIPNLLLGSAGAAPGGLVSGLPGWIAAQEAAGLL
jgi:phytoene dehydrogenase-like protein